MRVLHVTDTFLPRIGGAELAIDQLVRAMGARGVECAVLAQKVRRMNNRLDVPYAVRRYRSPQSSRWAGWWVRRHIAKVEKELGPFDAYVGHHAFPPGYAVVQHGRRVGRPAIVYPRGGDIYEVSRFRKKPAAWAKLTWALANSAAVVCASDAMERVVRGIVGISSADGRTVRIPNGVNIPELTAACAESRFARDPAYAGPFVLGLGRTIRRKGFHLLIDALAELPASDWKLVVAGDGRELTALKQQAAPLGGRVLFTGMVEGADKRWLLQNCRFMAAPSLEESFGNVALEAMACGRPVIASRASGFAEIVKDGSNGRLVKVDDVPALRAALADYTARDLSAERDAAAQTAATFSWDAIAARYVELIERVRAEW
ncbi:MAG: glycosyltransferase family 4 protein [Phycisphaerae bacterium]|nr:glycosyltransferase family 4 protein [Tepidisphaeraceae bacterium]